MFLAVRDLRFARGRFALMGLVVALLALLGVVLSGLTVGLTDDGISALRKLPITHLAFEQSASGTLFSRSTVTVDDEAALRAQPGVEDAALYGNTLAHATTTTGSAPGAQLDLALFGVDTESFLAPDPSEGEPLGAGNGILVSPKLVDEGLAIGDELTIDRVGTELRVVGTIGEASFGHVGVAYVPLELWQRIHYGLPGEPPADVFDTATAVALHLEQGADAATIAGATGTQVVTKVASYDSSPGYTAETGTMQLIQGFLYVISALVVGAFFTVWTVQRRSEIALVKALGASSGYVLRDAIAQVLVVVVGATLVGTLLGLGLGGLAGDEVPFVLQPAPVLASSLLIVALGVIGAAVAVRRVTRVDPLLALGGAR